MEDKKIEISAYEWSLNIDEQVNVWAAELLDKAYKLINDAYGNEFEDGNCFDDDIEAMYPEFCSQVRDAISDCLDSRIVFISDDD